MRDYETTFIVDAHLPDDKLNATIEKFTQLLDSKENKVVFIDRWGKRRLAYEIAKKQYGYYVHVRFQAEPTFIAELERVYKLDDSILRYLTVIVLPVVLKEEERKRIYKEKMEKADADATSEEHAKKEEGDPQVKTDDEVTPDAKKVETSVVAEEKVEQQEPVSAEPEVEDAIGDADTVSEKAEEEEKTPETEVDDDKKKEPEAEEEDEKTDGEKTEV